MAPQIENDTEDLPSILGPIISAMLGSTTAKVDKADEFKNFFQNKTNINEATSDIYLRDFLIQILNLPEDLEVRQALLNISESICFSNDTQLVKNVLTSTIKQNSEESTKVLIYFAQKYQRLRTIPKFVDYLLRAVKNSRVSGFKLGPMLEDCLADCVAKITVSQNMSMWTSVCQILEQEFLLFKENPTGPFPQTAIAVEVMSVLLLNIKLADYSIRDETIAEVITSFHNIIERLKTLVVSAIELPQVFLGPLLKLAFSYGDLHQLLLLYSQPYVELQPPRSSELKTKDDETVYDLSYFHFYASSEQWTALGQLEQENSVVLWGNLILQKIRYQVLFGGRTKQDKTMKKLIGWLVEHYNRGLESLWLNNFKYLLPFINPRQLETLGQQMIESHSWRDALLSDMDVTEKRSFQMTVICAVFRSIHDQSRKRKMPEDSTMLTAGSQSVLKMLSLQADVWIGSVDRSTKEVTSWLRQSADIIKEAMRSHENSAVMERDLTELCRPLDLIERLPLEYLIGTVHSAALMGLLSLLVNCNQDNNALKDRLWMLVVRLLDNTEKLSSLYEYFTSAELLTWVVSSTQNLRGSALIFSTLFDEILRSPQGLKDASAWMKSTDLTSASLSVSVLAMKKLSGNKKPTAVKMFSSLRKHFLASFEEALEAGQQVVDVIRGAHCLIQLYIDRQPAVHKIQKLKTSTEEVKPLKIKALLRKLGRLVETARKGILSTDDNVGAITAEFLDFLFAHQKALAGRLPAEARVNVWTAYRLSTHPPRWEDRLLRQLLAKASKKELVVMINALLDDLQAVSDKLSTNKGGDELEKEVQRVSSFLRHLVTADLPTQDDRNGIRLQAIQTILPVVQHVILSQCRQKERPTYYQDVVRLALPPMSIYLAILNLGPSYAYPHDVSSALHVCLALPLDGNDPSLMDMPYEHYEAVFTVAYKVLHYLLVKHEEVAADRIPVLLQVYRRLLASTCARSDQRRFSSNRIDGGEDHSKDASMRVELAGLTDCANRLSRLASVVNGQRLRYRRTATYLVSDVMDEFKKRPIHPQVKQELTTALHHLMDLLDQHAARYLLTVMPPGLRELFRLELDQFKKFYQFKGKV